jgi:hypothetical protein
MAKPTMPSSPAGFGELDELIHLIFVQHGPQASDRFLMNRFHFLASVFPLLLMKGHHLIVLFF